MVKLSSRGFRRAGGQGLGPIKDDLECLAEGECG